VTKPTADKEFYIKLYGSGFDTETVRVKVKGPGCDLPCEVPNGALRIYGTITETSIERVPLTIRAGDFHITVQNGDGAPSNFVILPVNDSQ